MSSSVKRREADVMKLMKNYKVELMNDGMEEFIVEFHGPKGSLYQGGVWKVDVFVPDDYPDKPPIIHFANKIYHPNIDEGSGFICLDVINQNWRPMNDLLNVFDLFLPQLLLFPNPSSPFNHEAAALLRSHSSVYEQTVKEYCEKYAKPKDEAESSEKKTTDKEQTEAESHSCNETVVAKPDH